MKKYTFKLLHLQLMLLPFVVSSQQIEYKADEFIFGSTNNISIPVGDYYAKNKIEIQPNCNQESFTNTHLNLSIDKTIHSTVVYQSEANATNAYPESESVELQLNKNLPVGSISGSPGVSASGSAGYSFTVFAPPGTNGMSPQIAVAYNSNMGDGAIGRGWNIGGISTISRTPKTIYHDGKTQGILLQDLVDSWALDGNLLVASPANGINTFRPEKENFSLVTFVDNNDNDKSNDYFKVQTEGGTTMYYGSQPAANSKLILKDKLANDQVLSWYVDSVEDSYGNYMTYSYYNDGGEIHIKEIKYTGNDIAGIVPYNSIKFYYDLRTTNTSSFFLGNELIHKLLLREIEVFCEEKSMTRYHFNYVNSTMPYLREIVKYGADNTHLNSTLFSYGAGSPLSETVRELIPPNNGQASDDPIYSEGLINFKNYVSGDFNGDGRSDQVSISVNNSGAIPATHLDWKLWLNTDGVMK
ncbi:MAG TPA: SpvB/TcaC N-terminal domain-containing protein, partial [Bacteroidia bacterium]|nr:SpvB/TcaC N-terminal domain-containing protein [Bacteroidia bacterium]